MRQPGILDMLRAVKEVGPSHAEIRTFWYAPPRRLRLRGEVGGTRPAEELEVVVEVDAQAIDLGAIGAELQRSLRGVPVAVRRHRGASEDRQLYRLWSRDGSVATGSFSQR
jgi:hypothetical protein